MQILQMLCQIYNQQYIQIYIQYNMKILKYIGVALVIFALILGILLHQILRIRFASELQYKGGKIEIKRVQHNIPQVHAYSLQSALYGWGYTTAEDRLFQLAFRRLSIKGQLSKYLGEKTIQVDKMFRQINLYGWAQQSANKFEVQNNTEYTIFKAYADGINDYYKTLSYRPLQFYMIGLEWQPWTVTDMLAMFKLIKWSLSIGMTEQYLRSMMLNNYTKQEIDQFLPYEEFRWLEGDIISHTTIIKDNQLPIHLHGKQKVADATKINPIKVEKLLPVGAFQNIDVDQRASNSWVISGEHTQSGHPLLCNDPHLQSALPGEWYQVKIFYPHPNTSDEVYIIAGSMIGVPLFIGKTTYVSLTMTTNYMDTQDLYRETIDGTKYLLDGEWKQLKVRPQKIQVKGRKAIQYNVYQTHRGPIIRHILSKGYLYRVPQPVSLRWVGYTDEQHSSISAYLHIGQMKSYEQVMETIFDKSDYGPPFNMIYATKDNHIGYIAMGMVPLRKHPHMGMYVQNGSTSDNDWLGFIKGKDKLALQDPQRGYIASANNKAASYRYFEGVYDISIYTARATRIQKLIQQQLAAGRKLNKQTMRKIQLDTVDVYCQQLVKGMKKKLKQDPKNYNFLFSIFEHFHCNFTAQSTTSSIYLAFLQNVYQQIHPFGANTIYNLGTFHNFYQYIYQFILKSHTHEELLKLNNSMFDTLRQMRQTFQSFNPQHFLYGKMHRDLMIHRPFSFVPWLRPFVEHQTDGFGNINTVNVGYMNKFHDKDYRTNHRANLRLIMSYYQDSQWVIDGGSSEKWYSKFYTDQTDIFMEGKYYVMDAVNRTQPLA